MKKKKRKKKEKGHNIFFDWPPGAKGGLRTRAFLAPEPACGRASWRRRRPMDGSPGAQVGLWTSLLAHKSTSGRAS